MGKKLQAPFLDAGGGGIAFRQVSVTPQALDAEKIFFKRPSGFPCLFTYHAQYPVSAWRVNINSVKKRQRLCGLNYKILGFDMKFIQFPSKGKKAQQNNINCIWQLMMREAEGIFWLSSSWHSASSQEHGSGRGHLLSDSSHLFTSSREAFRPEFSSQ